MKKNLITLLFLLYIIVYIIIFISPIKISKSNFLLGFLFSIIMMSTFMAGVLSVRVKKNTFNTLHDNPVGNLFYFMSFLLAFVSALYSIDFYTGSSIEVVFTNIYFGLSNYNDYQVFFENNILGTPIHLKLMGISSQILTKFICLYLSFKYFLFENDRNKFKLMMVISSFVAYIFFSLARGTFFEIFEISIIFVFVLFLKIKNLPKFLISKNVVPLMAVVVVILIIYEYNLGLRYGETDVDLCITQLICYDETFSIPVVGKLLAKLMGYFGFPFLYMSQFIEEYILYSFKNFVFVALPLPNFTAELTPRFLCDASFDCGASWSPFIEKIIINFGLILSFIIIFSVGVIYSLVFEMNKLRVMHFIFIYYMVLTIFSLPINDFIFSVSSNAIIFIFSAIFVLNSGIFKNAKSE